MSFPLSTVERQNWLIQQAQMIRRNFIRKYQSGMQEHEGDLSEIPDEQLLVELEAELLDAMAYLLELRRRLHERHGYEPQPQKGEQNELSQDFR